MNELHERLQRAVGDAFVVERELGGGGMSRLFLATEASLHRKVVIKLLAPELTGDVSLARFKREFELTATLQHPNILPVLGTGSRDGMLWYVTPYIAGESLRHRLQRETRLPIADVARILHEASDALSFAHERGVIHRDIKPENILLLNGHAVLADFGIAAALAPGLTPQPENNDPNAARLTQVGTAMGTPGYMSPEQAAGEWNLDARADVYALGCVGYEMLGGQPPFVGPTPRHVIAAHLSEPPKPIDDLRTDTPPGIAEAIMRALAKEPVDRWQSAGDFRDALGMSFTGARPGYTGRKMRRMTKTALAAGFVVGLLGVGALLWFLRGRAGTTLDENLVAVAPFEVLDPSMNVWREGMVDVLSANLDGMGPLRTVPPTTVIRRWEGRPDRTTATALGRKTGAKLVVYGRMERSGDSARVSATLFDVGTGRSLGDIQVRDESDRIDRIADSLTIRVLRELNQTRAIASVRRGSLGSSSIAAIRSYLQGEQHFRRSDFDSAAVYYERAIAADSTFAPALRKLGTAYAWNLGQGGENAARAYPLHLRAGAMNHGLAPRESVLVLADSINAAVMTNVGRIRVRPLAARLLAVLDTAVRRFPDDPEIWYRLGDARYHMLGMGQAPETFRRAREAFDRSITLDSAFAPSFIHPVDIALREQDVEGARRYMSRYLAFDAHDTYARSFRLMQQLTDSQRTTLPVDSLWASGLTVIQQVMSGLTWYFDDRETIVELLRNAKPKEDDRLGNQVRYGLALSLSMRGRVREAATMAAADTMLWGLRSDLALVGAYPSDSLDREARAFLRGDSARQVASAIAFRTWAERGDTAVLGEALRIAERWPASASGAKYWPGVVRGYLALAKRDSAEALRQLVTVPDTFCVSYAPCHVVRYTKVQLLLTQGRNAEAARTLDADFAYHGPLGALWQLAKGQANERLGERAKAIDAYTYTANALRKADPVLQPVREEALKGLRRLTTDRPSGGG